MAESRHVLVRVIGRYVRIGFTARHALQLVVITTTCVTLIAGVLMWLVDRTAYPTVGSGLWWALQTVTTVGYGDALPSNAAGRAVASAVMLTGIGFLTVATAAITAVFIEATRRRLGARDPLSLQHDIAALRDEIEALRAELRGAKK